MRKKIFFTFITILDKKFAFCLLSQFPDDYTKNVFFEREKMLIDVALVQETFMNFLGQLISGWLLHR